MRRLLAAAALLGVPADRWEVQNQMLDAYARLSQAKAMNTPLAAVFADLAGKLNISQGLLGWRP